MTDEQLTAYLNGRYTEMLSWYDAKAISNKRWYYGLSIYLIVVSAIVPVLISANPSFVVDGFPLSGQLLSTCLSVTVAVAAGLMTLCRFQSNWLSYRSTWDAMKREPHFRSALIGDYKTAHDPNALFVERVESLFCNEGKDWMERNSSGGSSQDQGRGSQGS